MNTDKPYAVTILTHEAGAPPLDQSVTQMLTDFLLSANVRLHTYVVASDLAKSAGIDTKHAHLTLVDSHLYKKECVQTTLDIPKNLFSEVMFLQCHGRSRDETQHIPYAGLQFRCPRNNVAKSLTTQVVWTQVPAFAPPQALLHEIVGRTRLAIILACHGDQVIQDYLKTVNHKPFPDMLIFNIDTVWNQAIEIYMSLLLNIVDSELVARVPQRQSNGTISKQNYEHGVVYDVVRAAITRIFQIVKLFDGEPRQFWDFLQNVQCVTDTRTLKQRQQLVFPKRYIVTDPPSFRTAASASTYIVAEHPERVYFQMKAMQLVSRGENNTVVREDWTTVAPIQVADSGEVDQFLREYQETQQTTYMPAPSPPDVDSQLTRSQLTSHQDLRELLTKLQFI